MKILAFNGSPRMKRGNTEQILSPFLEGAKEAGAEVELIYLRRAKMSPCIGCFNCWFRTPGICAIKDDVNIFREKLFESDMFIFATPVYLFSYSPLIKILMDRLLFPFTTPEFALIDSKVYHPTRYLERKWKCMLIANGAFDGEDVFKPLTDTFERAMHNVIDNSGCNTLISVGNITVGFAELFADEEITQKITPFFNILKRAGYELAQNGYITDQTQLEINKPLYHYAGITRGKAIEKINEIIAQSKAKYILPSYGID